MAALEKIFGTFEHVDSLQEGGLQLDQQQAIISFNNVSFAYKGYEDKPVLNDVSFTIKAGQVYALVGPTGSGKTSILRLLGRLYDGYQGDIYYDDVSLSEVKFSKHSFKNSYC